MPINYTHKILFIHIPKCAGTSVQTILETNTKGNFYTEQRTLEDLAFLPKDRFTDQEYRICMSKNRQHYTFKELTKILSPEIINNFKKISIVRNPYDRLVSEYYFRRNLYKAYSGLDEVFGDFVKTVLRLDPYTRNWLYDGHLETQTSYLINDQDNFNSIDKIFKFENLNECFEHLNSITNKNLKPHARATIKRKHFDEYYTPELKELVYEFYKEDFINFNY